MALGGKTIVQTHSSQYRSTSFRSFCSCLRRKGVAGALGEIIALFGGTAGGTPRASGAVVATRIPPDLATFEATRGNPPEGKLGFIWDLPELVRPHLVRCNETWVVPSRRPDNDSVAVVAAE
jgi:hypothetical protein